MPALLTRMSICPNASTVVFTAASTWERWETSQRTAIALLLIEAAASPAAFSLMSTTATRAPSRAKVSAMPLPKPDAPPVTSATLLSRRMLVSFRSAAPYGRRPRAQRDEDARNALIPIFQSRWLWVPAFAGTTDRINGSTWFNPVSARPTQAVFGSRPRPILATYPVVVTEPIERREDFGIVHFAL